MRLNAVIHQLQPLDMECLVESGPAISDYYQHYHLDIAASYPGVKQYIGTFESGRYEVAGQLFLQEGARGTVFMVHGYTDHLGLYGDLIRHLLALGYSVAGFDLPGHGLSSPCCKSISNDPISAVVSASRWISGTTSPICRIVTRCASG